MNGVARSASIHLGRFHPYVAALFASGSGTLMLKAGEVFSRQSWAAARPFALAGGLAIQLALLPSVVESVYAAHSEAKVVELSHTSLARPA